MKWIPTVTLPLNNTQKRMYLEDKNKTNISIGLACNFHIKKLLQRVGSEVKKAFEVACSGKINLPNSTRFDNGSAISPESAGLNRFFG